MTNATAAGTPFDVAAEASPQQEMAAFDGLPPEQRELLNYSTLDYSAAQIARLPAGGRRNIGAVVIEQPDMRGSVVRQIEAMNAAHGGRIEPKTPKVARATLRRDFRVARSGPVLVR